MSNMPRISARTAARARTTRPTATPAKATRKAAPKSANVHAVSRPASPARRPVSTPPAGRPKTAARTAVASKPPPAPAPVIMAPVRNGSVLPPAPPMPPARKVNFKIGDKAVHPKHGVGEVTAIEHRELGGTKGMFYVLRILDNGMKVMVPTNAASQAGLRGIMSSKEADAVLATMRAREVAVDLQPWSRRFRAYTEMVQSGSPHEVAKVLRDMHRLKFDKDLSFGERHLLDRAKSLLMKELAFAKKVTEQALAEEVAGIFRA